jgi:hypothetical protein
MNEVMTHTDMLISIVITLAICAAFYVFKDSGGDK